MPSAVRTTTFIVALGAIFLGLSRPLRAQGGRASPAPVAAAATPEALAERYIAALRASDWPTVAGLMHPRALATMRGFVEAVASRDSSGGFLAQMLRVGTAADLAALSDREVFERFLGATVGAQGMAEVLRTSRGTVLGHITEGADTAHVLYRLKMGIEGVEMTKVDVLSAARDGGGWRALLTADIENMIQRMRAGGE